MLELLIIWTIVSFITTHTVYFYFTNPWHGPNKVWWSVLLHLPLIIILWIFEPIEKFFNRAFSNREEKQSNEMNWKNIRW
jgi:hypothetical protein